MSNILVLADFVPEPDKAAGDLRFYTLLSLLASRHTLTFCGVNPNGTLLKKGKDAELIEKMGVSWADIPLPRLVERFEPDIIWIEFYYQARVDYVGLLRRKCPAARILVDSVDVHFRRLEARARLTGETSDRELAVAIKQAELAAYDRADMVIAVSEDDKRLLVDELPSLPIEVIPNAHVIGPFPDPSVRRHGELVFVGGFRHDPNVDAMLYFCRNVMPLITRSHPEVRLKIIGSNAPPEILALADERVEVLGYVPDTAPHLRQAYVSVAPLRYGGGMKGKVGEAMSYGVPVVATSFGAEGFGLVPGRDLLVADSAESFAQQVVKLLEDRELHGRIARNGYDFISSRYSLPAVEMMLLSALTRLASIPRSTRARLRLASAPFLNFYWRHVAWRLAKK